MSVVPRIADVHCSRIVFQPGDRILVTCHYRLEPEQRKKLRQSIERWAGASVEVLIYNPLDFDIEVEHGNILR